MSNGNTSPTPVDASALREELLSLPPEEFVSHHVLDRVPWIFSDRMQYVKWKSYLAVDLDVDPFAIHVVGSSCVGLSLSPSKGLSAFHRGSDIDVAVVSARHFDEAWRWLRNLGPMDSLAVGSLEHDMFKWHRKNLVFEGTIATDRLLSKLPFGAQWRTAFGRARTRNPTIDREIKARIYRDVESLREYQVRSVKSLLAELR
ncbi:hypothetical protein ABZ837_22165 [Streptomyces sp. NPDC047197]|uniref:hypothetical protein n=1 Tax=Streptomyces sp. NPDC047197 TaxID=3155477 RepID=UPI00340AD0AF